MTVAFRIDRERGRQLNVTHLMKIELKSFSIQDVRDFVARVRLTLTNVEHVHLEQEFMYQWLFEKFKHWDKISRKIERIKESRLGNLKKLGTTYGVP